MKAVKTDLTALMLDWLAESGLEPADGFFKPGECKSRAGCYICYPELDGTPSSFWRFRFLDKPTGFAALVKTGKYTQPAGLAPRAYFSTLCDWTQIIDDVSRPLLITEGEKRLPLPVSVDSHVSVWAVPGTSRKKIRQAYRRSCRNPVARS
jgi:hypothetical protein